MFSSLGLGLLALLRGIRFIGHIFKSFILRCLLFRPHILRNHWRIWSLCSRKNRTSPKDVPKKKGGQERPSFPGASGVCGEYSAIYPSRDFNRASEPPLPLGPGNAEVLPLSPIIGQPQSAPRSPASSLASSLPGSPQPFDRQLPDGSTTSIPRSHNADIQLPIRYLNTPLTLTHSRTTSTQFAGAPPRSRTPSPSPQSQPLPQSSTLGSPAASPGHSRSPSPSLYQFPQPHPLPQPSIPPNAVPNPNNTSEGYRQPGIMASSGNVEVLPLSPIKGQPQSAPRSPALSIAPSLPGSPQRSDRQRFQLSFPQPFASRVSTTSIPVVDTMGIWSDRKSRSFGLMHSEQVSRYVNKGDVSPDISEYILRPMEVYLPRYSHAKCPEGWVPATHPGGALYFYNPERRIFTDVYMYDPNLSAEIHACATYLDNERTRLLRTNDFHIYHYDLVIDIVKMGEDETIWAYYYIDHDTRTLFWLHHYDCGDTLLREVRGAQGASHVKLRLESLYWVHWSLYPTGPDWRKFPEHASNELLGALLSSGIDSLTSKVSTSPYSVAEMESMRDFLKEAESLGPENPHVITSVARLLSFYVHWRFLNFHGQKTSRQDRYKSIYKGNHRKRTILVRILSPMLFFFPDVHLRELEDLWTDKIIVEALWREFMEKLVSEWTDFVLYSIVMLVANVVFLAIPGVIVVPQNPSPPNAWIKASLTQITSSISLVFSIGSIITGLLLIRRNRTMMTKDPRSAWYYLHGMEWPAVGLEPLAIVFSLTYALLMWSAWGFLVALLIFSFQNTSRKIRITVGIAAGIIAILIVWCVWNTWDPEEEEDENVDWSYENIPQVGEGTQA